MRLGAAYPALGCAPWRSHAAELDFGCFRARGVIAGRKRPANGQNDFRLSPEIFISVLAAALG